MNCRRRLDRNCIEKQVANLKEVPSADGHATRPLIKEYKRVNRRLKSETDKARYCSTEFSLDAEIPRKNGSFFGGRLN